MAKVAVIFWSGTGNTEAMAKYIQEGAKAAGHEVSLKEVAQASAADVTDADIAVLGCPSMGDEVLEESEFEPFVESIESRVSGKKLALFGSYDWGDGLWMRNWTERMQKAGATLVAESLIVNNTPEGEDIERCKAFGKSLS